MRNPWPRSTPSCTCWYRRGEGEEVDGEVAGSQTDGHTVGARRELDDDDDDEDEDDSAPSAANDAGGAAAANDDDDSTPTGFKTKWAGLASTSEWS